MLRWGTLEHGAQAVRGENWMRFVFMDEAGTSGSRNEKCRIVAGVIIHADKQIFLAETLLNEALRAVPREFNEGFIFHAEDIMNNDKYRDAGWRLTDRINLVCSVLNIRAKMNIPVAFGICWSDVSPRAVVDHRLKDFEEQHLTAALYCIAQADKWIRKHAEPDEIAMIVAEQHDLARYLASLPRRMRERPVTLLNHHLSWTDAERARGYSSQDGVFSVSRIRDSVHFVSKSQDRLVWLADACAYGLKRLFSEQQHGELFGRAMGVPQPNLADFRRGPASAATIWRTPKNWASAVKNDATAPD